MIENAVNWSQVSQRFPSKVYLCGKVLSCAGRRFQHQCYFVKINRRTSGNSLNFVAQIIILRCNKVPPSSFSNRIVLNITKISTVRPTYKKFRKRKKAYPRTALQVGGDHLLTGLRKLAHSMSEQTGWHLTLYHPWTSALQERFYAHIA